MPRLPPADLLYNFSASNERSVEMNVTLPAFALRNASVFLHACVHHLGVPLDHHDPGHDPLYAYCMPFRINRFMLERRLAQVCAAVCVGPFWRCFHDCWFFAGSESVVVLGVAVRQAEP